MLSLKALEDHLDYLIECKEQCEDEAEDDYVDGKIHQLLRQLMPLQFAEMKMIEATVPLGHTDLF